MGNGILTEGADGDGVILVHRNDDDGILVHRTGDGGILVHGSDDDGILVHRNDDDGILVSQTTELRKELIDSIKDAVYDLVKDAIHERASLTDNAGLDDVLMDEPIDELKAIRQALGFMAGKGNCRIAIQNVVIAGMKKAPTEQDCDAITRDAAACVEEATENLPTGSTVLLTQAYMNKLFGMFYTRCKKREKSGCPRQGKK